MAFICKSCRDKDHDKCRGKSWCDCMHRTVDSSGTSRKP